MSPLGILFGTLVGFSLGLTGGGGAIFAVPLLVYGLAVPAREAVGISLVTVGLTALVGFGQRLRVGLVEVRTGLLFAGAGMLGAPVGALLSGLIPEAVLLVLFGFLMLLIAVRMWVKAAAVRDATNLAPAENEPGPTCRRDPQGVLHLTSRCAVLLAVVGLGSGVLSGMFGVGGGFIIVPALVTFSGMGMRKAVGTSLLVIALVSVGGIAGHLAAGRTVPTGILLPFSLGAVGGLFGGSALSQWLSGPRLQRVFSGTIVATALFVLARNLM